MSHKASTALRHGASSRKSRNTLTPTPLFIMNSFLRLLESAVRNASWVCTGCAGVCARARVCCRARVICTTMPDACTLPVGRTTCTERTHAEIYSLSRRYNASRSTPQCFEQYCSNALFLCPPVSLAREGKRRRWAPMPAARFGVGTDLGILSLRLGDCRSEEGRDGGGGRGGREGGEGG